jgi:hypothetical protein
MLDSQSTEILLHIFSYISPETLCYSCVQVNSNWYNLITFTPSLLTSWDRFYPFLFPHPPITVGLNDVKSTVMLEVMKNTRWRECRFKNRHYFEAYRGILSSIYLSSLLLNIRNLLPMCGTCLPPMPSLHLSLPSASPLPSLSPVFVLKHTRNSPAQYEPVWYYACHLNQ